MAGTHGKTTTASMLVQPCAPPGCEPGWLVGGSIGGGLAERASGASGEWLVVEADESDRSMLSLKVEIAVLTNVELDHHATLRLARRAARGVSPRSSRGAPRAVDVGPARAARARAAGAVEGPYDADASSRSTAGGSRFTGAGTR